MRRILGFAAVVAVLIIGNSIARVQADACLCATSRQTNGWCPVHAFGYVGGVKVTSALLYEAADAHGHHPDLSTFNCPTCRSAIGTNGFCEVHRYGFLNGVVYCSRLTYELAKGEVRTASSITCPTCRKNSETHGWCAKSGLGMVGPFALRNRQDFDRAVEALDIFIAANEASRRCTNCALAIITDGECPTCKIRYKDGKALAHLP